jgi:hypothetical protein
MRTHTYIHQLTESTKHPTPTLSPVCGVCMCMHMNMYVCMYVCMYIYIYIYIYIYTWQNFMKAHITQNRSNKKQQFDKHTLIPFGVHRWIRTSKLDSLHFRTMWYISEQKCAIQDDITPEWEPVSVLRTWNNQGT